MSGQPSCIFSRRGSLVIGRWSLVLGLALLPALACPADDRLYTEAIAAIDEGIPQVGIQKLRTFLAGNPSAEEKVAAQLHLANALISAGQPGEARKVLEETPASPEQAFLLVQSHLAAGEWEETLQALGSLPVVPSEWQNRAIFARAEALRGLGRNKPATESYAQLENDPTLGYAANLRRAEIALEGEDTAEVARLIVLLKNGQKTTSDETFNHYIQGRQALLLKEYGEAFNLLKPLCKLPTTLPASAYAGAYIGLARAQVGIHKADDAEDTLEQYLTENPESPSLEQVFAELDHVYSIEKAPTSTEMRRWTRDTDHSQRQALSIFYISRFDGRDKGNEAALKILENWIEKFPNNPLMADVLLEYGNVLMKENRLADAGQRFQQALALHPPAPLAGRLLMSAGQACFALKKYEEAAAKFKQASELLGGMADSLLYNSALCWLRAEDFARFLEAYQNFSNRFAESDLRRDLLVEEGLLQARSGNVKDAKQTLGLFARDFPEHRRIPEARLVLAELAFTASPPDLASSETELSKAEQTMPSPEIEEQTAYLRLFQSELAHPGKEDGLITEANAFLTKYPHSLHIPDVRMKLGEIYFRQKDYANARTQFEIIGQTFADSPLLEKALFLGAQSAIRSLNPDAVDGAIATLDKVVALKGPLAPYARYEQARAACEAGKLGDALVFYDDLLGRKPDSDLTAAALAGKGETLYLRGATDPKSYETAVQIFQQTADLPDVPRQWRNLALYKKGKALEKLGKPDEALTAYYDVLVPGKATDDSEWLWYYRAGFDAAQLLESQSQWEAAIAIYKKLAESQGPRAEEAKESMERLRLEHFIWEKK